MKRLIILIIFLPYVLNGQTPKKNLITTNDIKAAEKIIGLSFTSVERDSMLDALMERLQSYRLIRSFNLSNSVPPAITFNPIPVGFKFPDGKSFLRVKNYSGIKRPKNPNDLAFYSIGELAELIKSRQITVTELTKFFLNRLRRIGNKIHAVITLTEKRALKQAARADSEIAAGKYRGILHGIPYGVKDLLATKGYKTTWGAEPFKNQYIDMDATVIKKLDKAGAILIGKLTLGALAWGDVWFGGKTRTPWDTTKGSSGSSAGSAASVAAGCVPFAIGTETWGSIVSPSTMCGTTGLRPTYGRISRTGAMALSWSMDKIGVISRSAEDAAIVFSFILGPDGTDQTLYDLPFKYSGKVNVKKLKIGYLKQDFNKKYKFRKNDSLALDMFKKLGARLIPVSLPDIPVSSISFILDAEAAAAFDELTRSNKDDLMVRQIKNAWPNVFRAARTIPAVEYINANRIRYLLIQKMSDLFKKVDVIIAPSWVGNSSLVTNLTGHPCVVFPTGFNNGLPTSITIIGNLFDESDILALAQLFQDHTNFNKVHPKWVEEN